MMDSFINFPQDKTLVDLFEEQVLRTPENIAVEFEGEELTYRELNLRANQLAHYLVSLGVIEDSLVPICLPRSLDMIVATLGVLKAGGAYVPVDPDYPLDRIEYTLNNTNGTIIIAESNGPLSIETCNTPILYLNQRIDAIREEAEDSPVTRLGPHNLAYVIYTSGSTGRPKGVMIEHRNLVQLFMNDKPVFDFDETDTWVMFHSFCFDFSVWEMYGALLFGGKLIIPPNHIVKDAAAFATLLIEKCVTILNQTPSAFYVIQEYLLNSKREPRIRYVIFGGETLNFSKLERWLNTYPDCDVINGYGITETTIFVTFQKVLPKHFDSKRSLIGKPVPTYSVYVLDENLKPTTPGEEGELYIGGPGLARGYLKMPELTAERFITNPYDKTMRSKLYRSGDLVVMNGDSVLEYIGRIDNQVKIRGYRIELGEIENVLLENPTVRQAAVLAKDDKVGDKRLIAYIVPAAGFQKHDVLKYLESRLPEHMVPRMLMPLDSIPLTANGKIDKKNLPNPNASDLVSTVYVAPKSNVEKSIIDIWKALLQIDRIGTNDNFFELGGNSLLAQRAVGELLKNGITLPITKLYQHPTAMEIAMFLQGGGQRKEQERAKNRDRPNDVAVIGMAGRFPGANSIGELWHNLKEGIESIQFFSEEELDRSIPDSLKQDANYVKARGLIDGADQFDYNFFSINPRLAEVLDPQQRKFLEVSWELLETAGYLSTRHNELIGVYAGSGRNTYYNNNIFPNKELIDLVGDFNVLTLSDKDFLASRVAYALDLKGPAISVQSACSTSLLAIAEAVESIRSGQCALAIAGGVAINAPIKSGHLFEEGAILSRDGHTKTFDANAHGTLFSDGVGAVLLKDKQQAEQDGDHIYAIIKGVGVNNDGGFKGSFTAPSAEGQATCISMALNDADVDPSTVSYIEAHGTATPIGDPIEIEGLNIAFGIQEKNQYCAIGSIKSNIGHLTQAAGVAGFIKTCLSLFYKQIPPSINFTKPNPDLNLENSPFYVNHTLSNWASNQKRRAGVSSFGVGGTNVHIILEEYPQTEIHSSEGRPLEVIAWSAKTDKSREDYGENLKEYLDKHAQVKLADVAYTLHLTKAEFNHRRFVVASSREELDTKLSPQFLPTESKTLKAQPDQLAFVFPGQGAQYLRMGIELYINEPVFKKAIDECAEILKQEINEDIRQVIYPEVLTQNAEEKLNNTFYTQPALFITEYALAKLWASWGIKPDILIGHSIGEFVAAHLAGVFNLKDALHLIVGRARLISDLPEGDMLAVRAGHEEITSFLPNGLSIAAINSPNVCVVAGPVNIIKSFSEFLEMEGIPSKLLNTSHAFHSSMLDPIIRPFEQVVKSIQLNIPKLPIVSTLTGQWMQDSDATDPTYWARHLRSTVRFSDAVKTLVAEDQSTITLECGPGNSSTSLIKQQSDNKSLVAIPSLHYTSRQSEYTSLLTAVGQLWLNGVSICWDKFYSNQKRTKLYDLPTYSFERKTCWVNPLAVETASQNGNAAIDTNDLPIQANLRGQTPHQTNQTEICNMRKEKLIKRLKEILENASGIETEGVNPDSSFLEIGLDSLLLTQLALTLKKEFKLPITFRKLTEEYSNLSSLADFLDANLPQEGKSEPAVSIGQIETRIAATAERREEHITGHTANSKSTVAIELISQQIQLLAKQIALLSSEDDINSPTGTITNEIVPELKTESDITAEEILELKKPFGATAKIEKQSKELSPKQGQFLENLTLRYNAKTQKSKEYTQTYRASMADPRVVSGFRPTTKELVYQLVVERSNGSYLWDIDGNKYIDMLNGFGSNMLGYQPDFLKKALLEQIDKGYEIGPQHVLAGEVSQLICEFTKHDRAALCNTGSEAVLGAMRIARTVTGRSLIVAFTGSYHGIMDEVLVRGTKKLKTFPAAAGILPESVQNILVLDYGTDESLAIIKERADEIAAVLVEPVQSRRPEYQPIEFLKRLRSLTHQTGVTLIFDEIITGFRMHPGGIQALFDIKADLATYGKVVGGGMSIGVIAGKKELMDALDGGYWSFGDDSYPEVGVTYFAGTFVRHPLALATAKASLLYMKEKGPLLQEGLNQKTQLLTEQLEKICEKYNLPLYIVRFGSLWKVKYREEYPYSELLFTLLREKGVHIWDGFPCFITESHTVEELQWVADSFEESITELIKHDLIPLDNSKSESKSSAVKNHSFDIPPVPGALLGKDADGNPAWFVADDNIPGKYLQVTL